MFFEFSEHGIPTVVASPPDRAGPAMVEGDFFPTQDLFARKRDHGDSSVDQFHHKIRTTRLGRTRIQDLGNVLVVHHGQGLSFGLQGRRRRLIEAAVWFPFDPLAQLTILAAGLSQESGAMVAFLVKSFAGQAGLTRKAGDSATMLAMADKSHPGTTMIVADCLQQLRKGAPEARERLMQLTRSRLQRLAQSMLKDHPALGRWEDLDDVLRQASLRLWIALKAYHPAGSPETLTDHQRAT